MAGSQREILVPHSLKFTLDIAGKDLKTRLNSPKSSNKPDLAANDHIIFKRRKFDSSETDLSILLYTKSGGKN